MKVRINVNEDYEPDKRTLRNLKRLWKKKFSKSGEISFDKFYDSFMIRLKIGYAFKEAAEVADDDDELFESLFYPKAEKLTGLTREMLDNIIETRKEQLA